MDGVEPHESAIAQPADPVPDLAAFPSLCPYLATTDGTWRSSSAVREHRCVALTPPVPLALEKQRRLCLVADHVHCATYSAAIAAHPPLADRTESGSRAIARTTPTVLDHGHFDVRLPVSLPDRVSGQGLLVAVLGIAFAALLIARPAGSGRAADGPAGAAASPTPAASAVTAANSAQPSAQPSGHATAAPIVTARPVGTPAVAGVPEVSNPPASQQPSSPGTTYKVRSGDTLIAIAARYGTTVKALVTLNGLADASKLKVGQVLKVP